MRSPSASPGPKRGPSPRSREATTAPWPGYGEGAPESPLSLLFSILLACDGAGDKPEPNERCEPETRYQDRDNDGYGDPETAWETCQDKGVTDGSDCDDTDASIHPGAEDDCTIEVDFNCDGSIGYADVDADGSPACEDCDDTDSTLGPTIPEVCDGVDQDCDGSVDDDPVDGRYYYADSDVDGFGASESALRTCELPEGYTTVLGDCDDTNAAVNPDGVEVCDGADNDCDGATDDDSSEDAITWYRDSDEDGWGDEELVQIACEQPRRFTSEYGDCDDTDAAVSPGATEVCNGVDDDCDGATDDAESSDALTFYADTDGDGHGDAAVATLACALTDGLSDLDDDCDDTDTTVYPDAPESCDDVDDDCDGDVDEDPTDATSWYTDTDGDGWGAGTATAACDQPTGTSADGTDCDDTDGDVNPGMAETCDGTDQDCDGTVDEEAADADTWYADADRDGFGGPSSVASCTAPSGYLATSTDCDDGDASISPTATETCDGEDDDCDGAVDESDAADATTWYADGDGDGYGDPESPVDGCTAPSGTVSNAADCDDGDAAIHPGADETDCLDPVDYNCDGSVGDADTDGDGFAACEECDDADADVSPDAVESCDGIDDDCDGAVDEAGATGGATWYADSDGDGFGDPAVTTEACDTPAGFVADAEDCDDADGAVSPGAVETCDTTADDNCDGDSNPRNADGCTRFYFDWDGDGYGSTSNACMCEGDGYLTADNSDDCDDGDAAVSPGGSEVWGNGVDDDCDDEIDVVAAEDAADATFIGENASDVAGFAVSGAGDLNADGYADLLIGAWGSDRGGSASGAAYVVLGPAEDLDLSDADAELIGEQPADEAGYSVAGIGDVDGDGNDDVAIGATDYGSGGGAYLLLGPLTGTIDLSVADLRWSGATSSGALGTNVSGAGDLDGDGVGDLVATATGANEGGGSGSGAVYVLDGGGTSGSATTEALAIYYGTARNARIGTTSTVADLDGDGQLDLAIGASVDDTAATDAGAVFIVFGPLSGTVSLASADAQLVGAATDDVLGQSLAAADFDGDGSLELAVGGSGVDANAGAVYLFAASSVSASAADAVATVAGGSTSLAGTSVAGIGDLDGDSLPELLVGAPGDDTAGNNAGAAALFYGPITGSLAWEDATALFSGGLSDTLGDSVSNAGDTDGDGLDDLLFGADGLDDGGSTAGGAYLVLGR